MAAELKPAESRLLRNVLLKALALFILFNVVYYVVQPLPLLDHLTLYNGLFPGRERFAWSEHPDQSFSVSLARLDAQFASHRLAGTPKTAQEYRVVFLGDSSIWGLEVAADGTVPACLDRLKLTMPDGRAIHVYNLAYPAPNALRDTLILRHALSYQPDLIVWPITLRSLSKREFPLSDIVVAQSDEARQTAAAAGLSLSLPPPDWTDRTFWSQRSALAAWLQHQLQGFAWRATGIDYAPHEFTTPPQFDLSNSAAYDMSDVAYSMLGAGIKMAGGVPVLVINEPIYVSSGQNSNIRYNADYPRAAYDEYRAELTELAHAQGWQLLDLWDAVPPAQFIRTALHYTPEAACQIAQLIGDHIRAAAP